MFGMRKSGYGAAVAGFVVFVAQRIDVQIKWWRRREVHEQPGSVKLAGESRRIPLHFGKLLLADDDRTFLPIREINGDGVFPIGQNRLPGRRFIRRIGHQGGKQNIEGRIDGIVRGSPVTEPVRAVVGRPDGRLVEGEYNPAHRDFHADAPLA